MKHSRFVKGQKVILDEGWGTELTVTVSCQTPKRVFTTVKYNRRRWQVLTYRLSEIISDSSDKICPDGEQPPTEVEPNNSADAPSV